MPTTTKYIWDDENYLAEADGSDTINVVYTNEPEQYGSLISTRISGTTSYHHFDGIGSTRQLTNAASHATDIMLYDAWGSVINRTGATRVVFLWVGIFAYYFDAETGLIYIRSRMYGPAAARWMSADPAGFVGGANLYLFVVNCPQSRFDPSGLQCAERGSWNPSMCDECPSCKCARCNC